jgi:hypothetical protein
MMQFLKRMLGRESSTPSASEIARARAARRKPASSPPSTFRSTGPAPLPQVMGEGDSEQDWSEWESSMMSLDSQMQDLPESARVYEKDARAAATRPAPLAAEEDAFGKVGKNRDI